MKILLVEDEKKVSDLALNPDTHEVKRAGKTLTLSATEFNLLKFLMENSRRVASRSLILESVWGFDLHRFTAEALMC